MEYGFTWWTSKTYYCNILMIMQNMNGLGNALIECWIKLQCLCEWVKWDFVQSYTSYSIEIILKLLSCHIMTTSVWQRDNGVCDRIPASMLSCVCVCVWGVEFLQISLGEVFIRTFGTHIKQQGSLLKMLKSCGRGLRQLPSCFVQSLFGYVITGMCVLVILFSCFSGSHMYNKFRAGSTWN